MATKCSNCPSPAAYEYKITANASVLYCGKDLPRFLYARRDAGLLTYTSALNNDLESAIAALTPKAPNSTEEPTPKKKASKKKAE